MIRILALVLALNSYGVEPSQLVGFAAAVDDLPPGKQALFLALAWTETDFRPDAVSHAGAMGILQLMPSDDYTPDEAHDPEVAVGLARTELARWRAQCGPDWYLAAWNAGFRRCCQGWYIEKRAHTKPDGWFQCEPEHRSFQEKVERRRRIVSRWLSLDWPIADCFDNDGQPWPVAVLPGQSRKAQENANRAGLTCGPE